MYLFSFIVQILINYVICVDFLRLLKVLTALTISWCLLRRTLKRSPSSSSCETSSPGCPFLGIIGDFWRAVSTKKQDGRDDVKAKVVKRSLWSRTPVRSPLVDFYPHMNQASLAGPHFLSAYSGQAFDPNLTHFYPHRPVAFSKIFSIFIRILPQGVLVCWYNTPGRVSKLRDIPSHEAWTRAQVCYVSIPQKGNVQFLLWQFFGGVAGPHEPFRWPSGKFIWLLPFLAFGLAKGQKGKKHKFLPINYYTKLPFKFNVGWHFNFLPFYLFLASFGLVRPCSKAEKASAILLMAISGICIWLLLPYPVPHSPYSDLHFVLHEIIHSAAFEVTDSLSLSLTHPVPRNIAFPTPLGWIWLTDYHIKRCAVSSI